MMIQQIKSEKNRLYIILLYLLESQLYLSALSHFLNNPNYRGVKMYLR